MIVHVYDFKKNTWKENSKHPDLRNDGQATIRLITLPQDLRNDLTPAIIHVTVGNVNGGSTNAEVIQSIRNAFIPFPKRAGIWSGVLFATQTSAGREDINLESCTKWQMRQRGINLQNAIPCPPTIDRARLPNSELEELRYESLLFTSTYHSQLMDLFHPNVSKCFVQAIVSRYIIKEPRTKVVHSRILKCSNSI